jgi:hypothetical protein
MNYNELRENEVATAVQKKKRLESESGTTRREERALIPACGRDLRKFEA